MGPIEYDVAINSSPELLKQLNDIPIRYVNGAMVYLRDVAFVHDGFTPQTNLVRRDGRHSVAAAGSHQRQRLDAVGGRTPSASMMPKIQAGLPKSLDVVVPLRSERLRARVHRRRAARRRDRRAA